MPEALGILACQFNGLRSSLACMEHRGLQSTAAVSPTMDAPSTHLAVEAMIDGRLSDLLQAVRTGRQKANNFQTSIN